jgi:hypothetical protein
MSAPQRKEAFRVTLGDDEYFVLGDNRSSSRDSHNFGPITRELLIGRAFIRYWPPSEWAIITRPSYRDSGVPLPVITLPPAETDRPAVEQGNVLSGMLAATPATAPAGH